jgi:hypothetical protein
MISANNVYNLLTRCQQIFGRKYGGPLNVGPILSANKVYNLPTRYQQILVENYGGPTMAHP